MVMRISLRWKLSLLVAIPLLLNAVTALYSLSEQKKMFQEMTADIYEKASKVDTLILNADRDMYQSYVAYLQLETGKLKGDGIDAAKEELNLNHEQAVERVASAKEIMESSDLLSLAYGVSGRAAGQIFELFETNFNKWHQEAIVSVEDGKSQPIQPSIDESFQISRNGIDEIGESIDQYAKLRIEELKEQLNQDQLVTFISMIISTIVIGVFAAVIIYQIMKTIRSVVEKTKRVSDGDLTIARDSRYQKDELGQISLSVDDMIARMNGLIAGIIASTRKVSDSSSQLSGSAGESAAASEHVALHIQEVASGSESQARGAEETSRAIEEMAVGISRIAENTSAAADHSTATATQADQGQEALQRLVGQMDEVKSVISKLSSTIGTLENRSKEIGAIAEDITTFSNQTNILSLNASIEAARAGEQGRGFAVVAGEIRKLAASSLESAENINQLVNVTQNEIASASAYMQQTMQEVNLGAERVMDVHQNLDLIATAIGQMTQQLHENSAITQQMSASSEEVSASMEQSASTAMTNLEKTESVAAATEEQLALMESISAASKELDGIVRHLNEAVAYFKVKA